MKKIIAIFDQTFEDWPELKVIYCSNDVYQFGELLDFDKLASANKQGYIIEILP